MVLMEIGSVLRKYTVLATSRRLIQFYFYHSTSEGIRHYVLAYLPC